MKNTKRKLLILACSQTKSKDPSTRLSARERYTGPLWQTLKATDPDQTKTKVVFLSAQEGMRDAIWPVDQYEKRLTPELADQMIREGIGGGWPKLKPGHAGSMTCASFFASMTNWKKDPFGNICLVGGHLYIRVMQAFVAELQEAQYITRDADITTINGQIGYMRKDMRNWINES